MMDMEERECAYSLNGSSNLFATPVKEEITDEINEHITYDTSSCKWELLDYTQIKREPDADDCPNDKMASTANMGLKNLIIRLVRVDDPSQGIVKTLRMLQRLFKCHFCSKSFSSKSCLAIHLRNCTGEKPYSCHYCSKSFSSKSYLAIHLRTHTGEKPYNCHFCSKSFPSRSSLARHLRTHTGEKPYNCHFCSKSLSSKSYLAIHLRTHTGEKPYNCHNCTMSFSSKANLAIHLRTHTGEKPYNCHNCSKSFSSKNHLAIHLRTHSGEKPYNYHKRLTCRYCGKKMASSVSCQRHEQSHFGGEFECEHCGKHFGQKIQLVNHIHLHHLGIKRFNCHMCDKSYTSKLNLEYHTRGHYNDRRYECDICGKRSLQPITHNNHVKTHTGGDFVCPHCGRKYIRKSELISHLPVHEGNAKPYKCTLCKKSYMRRENFNLHLRQMHGQGSREAYNCTVEKCGTFFATRAALRKHMTTHAVSDDTNTCQQCGLIFYNSEDLDLHKISAHSRQPAFRCTLCSEGFDEQILYRRHMIVKHRTVLKVDNT